MRTEFWVNWTVTLNVYITSLLFILQKITVVAIGDV